VKVDRSDAQGTHFAEEGDQSLDDEGFGRSTRPKHFEQFKKTILKN